MREEEEKRREEEQLKAGQHEEAIAMLQEKDDMIEQLRGELETKRAELAEA